MSRNRRGMVLLVLALAGSSSLGAQEPLVLGDGRVTLGGDVSATFSCAATTDPGPCGDDTGFFNYSDYEHSTVRMLRLDVNASVRATEQIALLAELRSENGSAPAPYALYLRFRPWRTQPLSIQVGRLPPTFGAFARRTYAFDNILIGYPLGYQYLTSLRADAVPANADDLLRMRGRGWLSSFMLGNTSPDRGLPLATAFRWDTGVQAHVAGARADATVAVTTGSLGNPLVGDDNDGKQIVGRVAVHPVPGLLIAASGARGAFLTRGAVQSVPDSSGNFVQTAIGADAEYSRDYYLLRAEAIVSDWTLPTIDGALRAVSTSLEGRYKLWPGIYAAARVDHLGFSQLQGTTETAEWDAPVTRVELGGSYLVRRNLQLKVAFQRNVRDGGRVPRLNLGAAQVGFWF
jgi:hypothetical protein